jgi:hypothetical protein
VLFFKKMVMLITVNSYFTSVIFPGAAGTFVDAGNTFPFTLINQLQNQYVQGVEAYNSNILSNDPSGNPIVTPVMASALLLSLYSGSNEKVHEYPFGAFIAQGNGGIVRELADLEIELTKSIITVTVSGVVGGGYVAPVNFSYCRVPFYTRLQQIVKEDRRLVTAKNRL